jgi:hypothetical protein
VTEEEANAEACRYDQHKETWVRPACYDDPRPDLDKIGDLDEDCIVREAFIAGLKLASNLDFWSKTWGAARLRRMCALSIASGGDPCVDAIAMRCKVSRRRVFTAINEVREHTKTSLPVTKVI